MKAPHFQNAAVLDPPSAVAAQRPHEQGRLVVVIAGLSEEALLASRIRLLADAQAVPVLLFGVSTSESLQAELRRHLATTAAFLQVHDVAVEFSAVSGAGWLRQLQAVLNEDDRIACYTEGHQVFVHAPLSDLLSRHLSRTIHDMSGLHREAVGKPQFVRQAAVWVGSLLIIAVFGVLEARLAGAQRGLAQTIVLLLLILPELGLLLGWNSLFP